MRIAILVKEFPPDIIGGTETQTRRMARELARRNHDVTVYTKAYGMDRADEDEPMKIVRVPNLGLSPFVSTLTFVFVATVLLIRDAKQYDILQCMMIYPSGFVGWIVSRFRGVPYFAWIRGGDFYFMKDNPIKRWMMQRIFIDTVVLVQAENIREDVQEEFPDAQLEVLGNGVDVPDRMADGDAVIFVGRLKEQKGVEYLVRAMEDFDSRLLVVGNGPCRSELESLASSLNVNAEFVGEVPPEEVSRYLLKSKVFVLPAVAGEGLPNALLEAMAHGLPVISTDIAGIGNVIEDGKTGYVVEPGNSEVIQKRLHRLLDDGTHRAQMGQQARECVAETYSWDVIISTLLSYYEEFQSE